ncbi:tethering complex ATP-binding subunit VPS33 KNAG_0B06150 [Huiozyma naganishii CBS 8797]|uniref:Sec1-like protein n=1 Tax=Huiozyma naganishii (strain ATCC MYA-139 / BCRC 22969 / CBS 8797 / KCTC 17520 / NBRC 10181 / NCYC 3082 / Yp74L-3) TaxID=1071383 RepID=J7R2K7_HUIN7|nr:hypothetical protein KNAG_0B06150 [Kazachstania naganishii CBS 8797]CCK69045.1 hypothetical protein KNAG_0B06150 [Kazachstania naganishii CBS 8797]
MDNQWDTRSYKKLLSDELCSVLGTVSSKDQILVVQPNILPFINRLITFSKLTSESPVRKVVILDGQLTEDLQNILGSSPEQFSVVFFIDVRKDLTVPKLIPEIAKTFKLKPVNVVYMTWEAQQSNYLKELPHFITSQIGDETKLFPLDMLPIAQIDDDVLICDLLYNSSGESLYHPNYKSMEGTTRAILADNMANCIESLLRETKTTVTNAIAIGPESQKFAKLLKSRINAESTSEDRFIRDTLYGNKYDTNLETDLIVLERNLDPITPMLTQLTYAGIVDDLYQFDNDSLELKKKKASSDGADIVLNYLEDDIWEELKYLNFGSVGPKLNRMAKDLQSRYDARHGAETVDEIKNFVDSLATLQEKQRLLKMHTTLSSDVLEEVETSPSLSFSRILEFEQDILADNLHHHEAYGKLMDLIFEGDVPRSKIMKLASLIANCKGSIRDKDFVALKKEFVDAFGVQACFQFDRLMEMKYIHMKSSTSQERIFEREYRIVSLWFNTLPRDDSKTSGSNLTNTATPREATFAFCGVVPITMRYVQSLYDRTVLAQHHSAQQPFIISSRPRIQGLEPVFEQIYGSSVTTLLQERWVPSAIHQSLPDQAIGPRSTNGKAATGDGSGNDDGDLTILVFLGGITLGELATLRHLQAHWRRSSHNLRKRFVVVVDGLWRLPGV